MSKFIIYTKIFQWICFENDNYIPQCVTNFLKIFTNKAPYVEYDIDRKEIEKLLENKDLIIESEPINSGTISLVFKGYYKNKPVAIKILRYNIENRIKDALYNIKYIFDLFSYLPYMNNIPFEEMSKSVFGELKEQIDFERERKNIMIIHNNLRHYKTLKTIKTIDELCTTKSIIMDFIVGKTVYDLTQEEKKEYSKLYVSICGHMNFKKAIIHLDVHPGNILFLEENGKKKVCLLDMGMILNLDVDHQNFLVNFIMCICEELSSEAIIKILSDNLKPLMKLEESKKEQTLKLFKICIEKENLFKIKNPSLLIKDIFLLLKFAKKNSVPLGNEFYKLLLGFSSFLATFTILDVEGKLLENLGKNLSSFKNEYVSNN